MTELLITFEPVILIFHFILAILLICVILLQAGKGTDIGAAFGAGGSQTVFGAGGGGNFLTKLTTTAALLFLVTSLSLATTAKYNAGASGSDSVITKETVTEDEAPATDGVVEEKAEDVKQEN